MWQCGKSNFTNVKAKKHFPHLFLFKNKYFINTVILGYNADIISLQEVDSSAFTSYYKDIFRENGYMSFFHKKGDRISEGLACIFNKTRFK